MRYNLSSIYMNFAAAYNASYSETDRKLHLDAISNEYTPLKIIDGAKARWIQIAFYDAIVCLNNQRINDYLNYRVNRRNFCQFREIIIAVKSMIDDLIQCKPIIEYKSLITSDNISEVFNIPEELHSCELFTFQMIGNRKSSTINDKTIKILILFYESVLIKLLPEYIPLSKKLNSFSIEILNEITKVMDSENIFIKSLIVAFDYATILIDEAIKHNLLFNPLKIIFQPKKRAPITSSNSTIATTTTNTTENIVTHKSKINYYKKRKNQDILNKLTIDSLNSLNDSSIGILLGEDFHKKLKYDKNENNKIDLLCNIINENENEIENGNEEVKSIDIYANRETREQHRTPTHEKDDTEIFLHFLRTNSNHDLTFDEMIC